MGKRLDFWSQVLADCIVPFIIPALYIKNLISIEEDKMHDSYYQPPEAQEREAYAFCDECDHDTLTLFTRWMPGGEATAECTECGQVSDVEFD